MVRGLLLAGLFLASSAMAGNASAAYVLIDNFFPGSTSTAAVRGGTVPPASFAAIGNVTMTAGDVLSYSNLGPVIAPPSGLVGLPATTIRFNGVNSAGAVFMTASANGGGAIVGGTAGALVNGVMDFTFVGLNPDALSTLSFTVAVGSFTANGLYAVPEPATMAMLGLAAAGGGLGFIRRRKKASV